MVIQVFMVKRYLRDRRRNGQRKYRWALRWVDSKTGKWRYETTGTADRTQAEAIQKVKWGELNISGASLADPKPEVRHVTGWLESSDALRRAMEADNLRPSYVADALLMLAGVRAMFPEAAGPEEITVEMAHEYKRRRAELKVSPWTIKGDLAALKAVFGKWLGRECGLLKENPFSAITPPRCDDPEIRIVSAAESKNLFDWLGQRWNEWRLPLIYLEIAALIGWRATEIASIREEDLLADGYVRVTAQTCKTRRHKYGWLPPALAADIHACAASGWAFGRFPDELRRLMFVWRHQPHHAARVKDFSPKRLVGWIQDELQRFNEHRQAVENAAAKADSRRPETLSTFTLHDFRRTAITGMQMSGVSEKEAGVMVGATPEVMRKHYEKLDQLAIARKNVERRIGSGDQSIIQMHRSLRAGCARGECETLDDTLDSTQTIAG